MHLSLKCMPQKFLFQVRTKKKKVLSILISQGPQNPIHNNFGLFLNCLLTTVLNTGNSKTISELCSMKKLPQKKENFAQ